MPRKALKQRADKRYLCWYKGVPFYGKTSDEALDARDEYKHQDKAGMLAKSSGVTVESYANDWIVIYKSDVSKATYNAYAHYLNIVCASLGNMRMKDVTASDIKALFNSQKGKGAWRIKKFCIVVKSMFRAAQEDGIIQRNPCSSIKPPKGEEGTHRVLDEWECELVRSMVGKHRFAVAAMLMLYGGLRRGEALAFDVNKDVDFEKSVIRIQNAVAFEPNQPTLKEPKSKAGIREVPLFAPLREALKHQSGLVSPRDNGEVMSGSAFSSAWNSYIRAMETQLNGCSKRWYGKTREHKEILAAGGELPPWRTVNIRTHDFRHTFCSMLYNANVDVKTAMRWMGHTDEKMILRVYAHLSDEKEKASALSVSKLLNDTLYSQNDSQTENSVREHQ